VQTSSGYLRGARETSGLFHSFYAFRGIPYGKPPVGELRFRNPVQHEGWDGVRDALRHANHCPNSGFGTGGQEDCLYLNVYTPNLKGNLSVMFWVHGGAFIVCA
jgi:bile salt-stimulated lipase